MKNQTEKTDLRPNDRPTFDWTRMNTDKHGFKNRKIAIRAFSKSVFIWTTDIQIF